jgi:hypothetical protein
MADNPSQNSDSDLEPLYGFGAFSILIILCGIWSCILACKKDRHNIPTSEILHQNHRKGVGADLGAEHQVRCMNTEWISVPINKQTEKHLKRLEIICQISEIAFKRRSWAKMHPQM